MNNKFKWFLIVWLGALTIGAYLLVQEPVRFGGTNQKIISNKEGNVLEVLAGGKILVDANATLAVNGAFQPTVVSINGTPVFWATPIPTSTPANTATPALLYGNTPAVVKEVCKTVNVIGQATVTFPGITTPRAVGPITLNNSGLGNADYGTFDNATGVITIYTYRVVAQTPVAATTVVAVDVCAKGN